MIVLRAAAASQTTQQFARTADAIIIQDPIYGEAIIQETTLIKLLESPAIQRLKEVTQHGITAFLGWTPPVTRFEHSVGAMLLVRKLGCGK